MASFESNGFASPFAHRGEEQSAAPESVSPPAPMQPFDEARPLPVDPAQEPFWPLQPLESASMVESLPVQQVETVQLQPVESAPPVPTPRSPISASRSAR